MELKVCIVDDHLASRPSSVDDAVLISPDDLRSLLDSDAQWHAHEINLKGLLKHLLESDPFKKGLFDLKWALNPRICLNAIDEGYRPDLIVFDWIYGAAMPHGKLTAPLLKMLFDQTTADFFVFSTEPDPITGEILRSGIDDRESRIRVLEKGESLVVMTADELISNWVFFHSGAQTISLLGKQLSFHASDNLKDPLDLLYLRDLLPRPDIELWLESLTDTVGSAEVAKALALVDRRIINSGPYLISPQENTLLEKYGTGENLGYAQAFMKYGLRRLWIADSEGHAHT